MPAYKKNVITIDKTSTEANQANQANQANEANITNIMQTKAHKNSPVSNTKESKNKDDYCKELKNIAYKTMLLNGQEIVPEINNTSNNI